MKVGFVGLGNLGKAMATRLRSQGVDLIVWNRTPNKAMNLGVRMAVHPAALMAESEIVFLNLFDSLAVKSVLGGKTGLLAGDCSNKLVIDTTTNHFQTVAEFYKLLAERGAQYLEAPVLGTVRPALEGTLTMLVSGDQGAYDRALPYLQKLAAKIFYLKEKTLATKLKLINNLVLGSFMETIAEAVAMGEKAGTSRESVLDILSSGAGNSTVLNGKREMLIRGEFPPQFSLAAIHKDLNYLKDLAAEMNHPMWSGETARTAFAKAINENHADLDFAAVYNIFRS